MAKNLTNTQVIALLNQAKRPIGKLISKKIAGSSIQMSLPIMLELFKKLDDASKRQKRK